MSHREEPEEMGYKTPFSQRSRQPKGTSIEGGRARWRPCQLNSQDAQGNQHNHQQYHHHQQAGTGRAPPRRGRRHASGNSQRRVSDSREGEPRTGPPPRPGYRHRQHRYRQQASVGYGNPTVLQPIVVTETDQVDTVAETNQPAAVAETDQPAAFVDTDPATVVETGQAAIVTEMGQAAGSPEESSQDLLSTHLQQELTTPSPKEAMEQDAGSPGLRCSSSTESLQACSEQIANLKREPEWDEREKDESEGGREEWKADGYKKEEEQTDFHEEAEQHKPHKGNVHAHSRRVGLMRVDVPPCAVSTPLQPPVDHTHSFSGTLRVYSSETKPSPAHFSLPCHGPTSTGPKPECRPCDQSCEDPLADSSPEACSHVSVQSYPTLLRTIPAEAHGKPYRVSISGRSSEAERSFVKIVDVPCTPAKAQPGQQGEPSNQTSVGSRLCSFHQRSAEEAGGAEGRKHPSYGDSFHQESRESHEEHPDVGPHCPDLAGEEALEGSCIKDHAPTPCPVPTTLAGDAISLAIRDIKEAIEEVKTKAVRSPYTPAPPTEPVWVMRQDVGLAEEDPPQGLPQGHLQGPPKSHRQTPPLASDPRCMAPDPDAVTPLGAESSRTQEFHDDRLPPSFPHTEELRRNLAAFPTYVDVAGPCDPEDLIDGIIFAASYLGWTQLLSDRMPSKSGRMHQAQEAMSRVRQDAEGESSPNYTEVDLFLSTQRIKVLNADTQEIMMDHPLRTISYIADIGNTVVLMARGKMVRSRSTQDQLGSEDARPPSSAHDPHPQYRMVCHVFESEDAQLIAQSIGQAFSVAYQEFLRANGIDPDDLSQREYSDLLSTQDMYNDDLIHFSKSENCRDVHIEKQKGEILGVVIVESGWGSILPTVIIASLMHSGPAAKSGRLNIGDQIMTVNGTSLVGLPLSTCQSIIKGLKSQSRIKLNIVRCPPVTMVLIRRPDLRYQLGFSVQNGIICSLMRGGIAERGGVRVGHRIIEINGQSVVATPHEKIVHILSNAVGEIHMKTMPAAMYRLLTAQEQPIYI